jgi:two-component system, cell cycle sensor histidine kinase and response regulator CckA
LLPLMNASIQVLIHAEKNICVEIAPDNIAQILMNLCINARDAMPTGGNIIIEVKQEKTQAVIRVVDTGMGIPEEIQNKIFDPFFTTKDPGKGTGLGLSLVYGLVKGMNGEIHVESKRGIGTIFSISLPTTNKEPDVYSFVENEDGTIQLQGITALIAEDEPELLNLISGMLEEMGAKVLRAQNGNEALLLQEDYEGDIDFLLTDVVMPELNGVKLAELFIACRPESKVMFMSGYPAHGPMAPVQIPDGVMLMPKPIDYSKLSKIITKILKDGNDNFSYNWRALTGQWKTI